MFKNQSHYSGIRGQRVNRIFLCMDELQVTDFFNFQQRLRLWAHYLVLPEPETYLLTYNHVSYCFSPIIAFLQKSLFVGSASVALCAGFI